MCKYYFLWCICMEWCATAHFSFETIWQYWLGIQKFLQCDPKPFKQVSMEISYLTKFSTN